MILKPVAKVGNMDFFTLIFTFAWVYRKKKEAVHANGYKQTQMR